MTVFVADLLWRQLVRHQFITGQFLILFSLELELRHKYIHNKTS